MWTWNCSSITQWSCTDTWCGDFQREESVRGWSPSSTCRTQIKRRIAHWTSKIRRRRVLRRNGWYWHPRPMFQVRLAPRILAQTLSAFLLHKRLFTEKEPFLRMKSNGRLLMPFSRRRHWDTIRWVLLKNKTWSTRVLKKKSVGYTSFVKEAARWDMFKMPYNKKKYLYHRGCTSSIQSILENGLTNNDKPSSSRHLTLLVEISDEEEPRDDDTIPQKVHNHNHWKRNQDAVHWVELSRAQDQGLQFWQTESYAIIERSPVLADCTYIVISQNGDPILFERLSTPPLAPKVTLKSNWQSQQQRDTGCQKRHSRRSNSQKETCARFCARCWEKAILRNWSSSGRSISRCYLTRWSKDEWNQRKVEDALFARWATWS